MPWTAKDAKRHKKGLTPAQSAKWAKIANAALESCRAKKGKDCEGYAIRVANSKFSEGETKMENKLPKGALRLVEEGESCFAFAETGNGEGKQPKLRLTAYSGGVIKDHWYWGNLAIDLEGLEFPLSKYPVLEDHNTSKKIAVSSKPVIKGGKLELDPETTFFVDTEESREFQKLSADGFPYQSSIYARPTVVERVSEGAVSKVNGFNLKGPASIWRKAIYKESSVCVFGWDSKTQASAFSREETEDVELEYVEKGGDDFKIRKNALTNETIKEVNSMDLNELKEKYPDLYLSIVNGAKEEAKTAFDAERARLQAQIDERDQRLSDQGDRLLKLEKSETIRQENELKMTARSIWDQALAASDIPERIYDKVRRMVPHTKFVEKGVLNETAFTEAVENEIQDWEGRGAKTSVMGSGFIDKDTDPETKKAEKLKAQDDSTVADLLATVGKQEK